MGTAELSDELCERTTSRLASLNGILPLHSFHFLPGFLLFWHNHRITIFYAVIFIGFITLLCLRVRPRQRSLPALTVGVPRSYGRRKWYVDVVSKLKWPEDEPQLQVEHPDTKEKSDLNGVEEAIKVTRRPRPTPKRVTGSKILPKAKAEATATKIQPLVFYFSLGDTTRRYATASLSDTLCGLRDQDTKVLGPKLYDLSVLDYEDFFEHVPLDADKEVRYFYILLIPSYNIDTTLDNFLALLKETHNDFRIDAAPLSNILGYSVFGFGDLEGWPTEAQGFCYQAIEVDKWMAKLAARRRAYPLGLGNVKSGMKQLFEEWSSGVCKALSDIAANGSLGEGAPGSGDAVETDEEEEEEQPKSAQLDTATVQQPARRDRLKQRSQVDDLEDIGPIAPSPITSKADAGSSSSSLPIDFTISSKRTPAPSTVPKPMVPFTSPTHAALTKQGYTIIGTHSGVKICRWTKSALRGRGSCYKYSFYGIKSHLCMETTPSLSCSNKCVFCWRHGTNPVGTTWRWQVDPPEMIFNGAKEGHYKKIKMMRGVPGVRAERFQEAMQIRHCALSLVGEPIFYPHINEFIGMLHKEHISSFLVCNAQHPDQLAALEAVTQLYVSIDASNAESLRKIDRPLHRDFWQRFMRCLDILHEKRFRMRTVFRLTLVKGFNIEEEVDGYADLVTRGLPCFVEIKGVTYCGTSSSAGAGLTMQNVPFYDEIVAFVEALNAALGRRGLEYGIAAEHAHSCCVLIASKRFLVDGKWHTRIDYDKFFECLESGGEFSPEDYMDSNPTPDWATWGNGGFDPADVRVDRKGKPIQKAVEPTAVDE